MLTRFSFILVFLTTFNVVFSQEATSDSSAKVSKNRVYLELLGKGFYYSMNFEREFFTIKENLTLNGSIGFGLFDSFTTSAFDPLTGEELSKKEQKDLLVERSSRKRMPGKDRFVPMELNFNYSFGNHHAIVGYGTTFWSYEVIDIEIDNSNIDQQPIPATLKKTKEWFAHLTLDYRYQKPNGGFIFKAGFTPLFFAKMNHSAFTKKSNYQASFNLGVGWGF